MRGLGIAMDSNWKPMFVLEGDTARADACLIRPYNAAVEDPSLGWENAGYWAAPHTLSGDNIRLISYSVPLIAPDGTVYGVLGVDILEDYLLRLLPYDELSEDHGSAYILGVRGAADPEAQWVVVLGAGVNGTVPSQALRERLEAAQDYLARYPEAVAVLSGAQGDGEAITEAQCMYDWLTARGVVPDRLRMETKATTTEENLRCSLDLIEAETGTRPAQIAAISGEYHLLRAELLARRAGAEALGVPSYTHDRAFYCLMLAREVCGVWAALLF